MHTRKIDPKSCRVVVLAGGKSGERDISLASGEGASKALRDAGFDVTVVDPAEKDGLKLILDGSFDVAFICLHGRDGEDGAIQGFLELIELPYIGSGIWSSASAMNKAKAKSVYLAAGLPTPDHVDIKRAAYERGEIDLAALVEKTGEHCVVKAVSEGSSLGLAMVKGQEEIDHALRTLFETYDEAVVERFVEGVEFTVVVLGNEDAHALPVIEIVPANDFYDFEAKYAPGGSKHLCPAPIDDMLRDKLQHLAEQAHQALGCRGMSRTDFIVEDDGSCWILETNTIPGMTPTSLLPDAGRAAGMSFSEVCTELVRLALE